MICRDVDSKGFDAKIGAFVHDVRMSAGLSVLRLVEEMSNTFGIFMDERVFRRAENGDRPFYPAELLAICSVLQVPLSDLPLPSAIR